MAFRNMIWNIVYALVLFGVIFLVLMTDLYFKEQGSMNFTIMPQMSFVAVGYPIIGALVGLPVLVKQYKHVGSWKVNTSRLLLIALPAFILANFVLLLTLMQNAMEPLMVHFMKYVLIANMGTYVFQILFGYALITSFYKIERKELTDNNEKSKSPI